MHFNSSLEMATIFVEKITQKSIKVAKFSQLGGGLNGEHWIRKLMVAAEYGSE